MLQLKVIDQTHYRLFGDKEYLVDVLSDGRAILYACDDITEDYFYSVKQYVYLHTYASLDNLLHCVYERSER